MLFIANDDLRAELRAYSYYKNGLSIRTKSYRLTKYFREAAPDIELFDPSLDPSETKNITMENKEMVATILPKLEKGNSGIYQNTPQK